MISLLKSWETSPAFLYFLIEQRKKSTLRLNMTITFAERADQLCDRLREMEHHAEEGDQLFYCAYLLGLLGLHSGTEGEGQKVFDNAFTTILQETLEVEGVMESDQENITALWATICKKEIS